MRQSLTESQQCQQYVATAMQLAIRQELPDVVARNTKFRLDQSVDTMGWVASLVSTFAKRLVKSEAVNRTVESVEKKNIELYYWVPKRPVDYLLMFIGHYIPWFNRFIRRERAALRDVVTTENIKNYIVEHYHLLPMEGQGHEMRYYLMSWDGEYYDGSPTEWNDLKAIRDFLENEGVAIHDLSWADKLRKLFMQYQYNKQSMAITSDRSQLDG